MYRLETQPAQPFCSGPAPLTPALVLDIMTTLLTAGAPEHWPYISSIAPDITPAMLNVADLMHCTDCTLTQGLNCILRQDGLRPVSHVSEALDCLEDHFMSRAEHSALEAAVQAFFQQHVGPLAQVVQQQWPTCREWLRRRRALAQPKEALGIAFVDLQRLQSVRVQIEQEPGYASVREAALLMASVLKDTLVAH